MGSNLDLSVSLIQRLLDCGVRKAVICAGSFNSPVTAALNAAEEIEKIYHFEERSAAFFAYGWSKNSMEPVIVCVTSGTAVAECLPAVIESYYSGTEIIIISADRQPALSGSGYPQAIRQSDLLSSYCLANHDIDSDLSKIKRCSSGPLHINLRFSEPVMSSSDSAGKITSNASKESTSEKKQYKHKASEILKGLRRPLIIIDSLPSDKIAEIENFLLESGTAILAEARSGLRESEKLQPSLLHATEKILNSFSFDAVIRIGEVPSCNLWRALERHPAYKTIPVFSFCNNPAFSGLGRNSVCFDILETDFSCPLQNLDHEWINAVLQKDQEIKSSIDQLILKYPLSEAAFVRKFSEAIPEKSYLYLGNSLPIREWNEFASFKKPHARVDANRGANGIDGQIASFLGGVKSLNVKNSFALIGDLTFLYDCNSLALINSISENNLCIAVINNRGGQIFRRLDYFHSMDESQKKQFTNQHAFSCSAVAKGFGLESVRLESPDFPAGFQGLNVIELLPDEEQSLKFQHDFNMLF